MCPLIDPASPDPDTPLPSIEEYEACHVQVKDESDVESEYDRDRDRDHNFMTVWPPSPTLLSPRNSKMEYDSANGMSNQDHYGHQSSLEADADELSVDPPSSDDLSDDQLSGSELSDENVDERFCEGPDELSDEELSDDEADELSDEDLAMNDVSTTEQAIDDEVAEGDSPTEDIECIEGKFPTPQPHLIEDR
jgi:hypothetical protein